ncbi:MAG: DUF1517 domain-containing protein [Sandaracinaceae bacterium]
MDTIDVTALMLGIDREARPEVQRAMNDIAEMGDSGSPAGLVQMMREAIAVLRGVRRHWTHAGVENTRPMPEAKAEGRFAALTKKARRRFEEETIRNKDGVITRGDASPLPPSDVPGVVVVTLVVAARQELLDVADVRDGAQLERAFDGLMGVGADDFVAMEVIWSPSDENDRATSAMVEAKYPELTRLSSGRA